MTVHDSERGCGWRKVGGVYLVADGSTVNCGRLPIPLTVCSCCGQGYKPSRGWTWVNGREIMRGAPRCRHHRVYCISCPFTRIQRDADDGFGTGLLWVGEEFYPSPRSFLAEVEAMGISRRLQSVPHGFDFGKTYVLLAHRHAVPPKGKIKFGKPETGTGTPGIFAAFRPSRVEIVVTGDEPDSLIDQHVRRGLTPVRIVREQIGFSTTGQEE